MKGIAVLACVCISAVLARPQEKYKNVTVDLVVDNFVVPSKAQTWHCAVYNVGSHFKGKHHLIRYEPHVSPGSEELTHHIEVKFCTHKVPAYLDGVEFDCHGERPKELLKGCENLFISTAIDSPPYTFPPGVGLSLGTALDPQVLILEIHYYNHLFQVGKVDNSGIRLTISNDPNMHDAGVIESGYSKNWMIPPHMPNFEVPYYCTADCLHEGQAKQDLHVFAVGLHAHKLVRQIYVRHIDNNGTELPPLAKELAFKYYKQYHGALNPPVKVKPGDSYITECVFDSTSKDVTTVLGVKEMCLSFIYYYPRIPLKFCESKLTPGDGETDVAEWVKDMDFSEPGMLDWWQNVTLNTPIVSKCKGFGKYSDDGKIHQQADLQPKVPLPFH